VGHSCAREAYPHQVGSYFSAFETLGYVATGESDRGCPLSVGLILVPTTHHPNRKPKQSIIWHQLASPPWRSEMGSLILSRQSLRAIGLTKPDPATTFHFLSSSFHADARAMAAGYSQQNRALHRPISFSLSPPTLSHKRSAWRLRRSCAPKGDP